MTTNTNDQITLETLPEVIRARFTPFAFLCDCEGNKPEPECYATRRNPTMIATHETIERIARFIETLAAGHQP